MFIGHFAVALAGKRVAPRTSLGTLLFGCQFLDLLWPVLVIAGVERLHVDVAATKLTPLAFDSYPISHSLLMAAVWSLLIGGLYLARTRYRAGAWVLGIVVFSHWILDWLTHRPDLPLAPGLPPRVGLGLWNHPVPAVAIETLMFALSVYAYGRGTRARDAVGRWGFIGFALVSFLIYAVRLGGPPPPNGQVVAISALALWLFVLWAAWFDRHRVPKTQDREGGPAIA